MNAVSTHDALQAMRRRGRMGLLASVSGQCRDKSEFWIGYCKAIGDLERGAGRQMAEKDAGLPYVPLGGFEGATLYLDQDIERLSRGEILDLLTKAGVQVAPDRVPAQGNIPAEYFEHGVVTAVIGANREHATHRVAGDADCVHAGSLEHTGGAS